ncbi:MAG: SAM-dependent methyltransferase [Tannerellaceae bacterium]|jgi:predicted O-methyltransferase YrrM|nr:SAM-dependent methyltransferase [Tannerellaceae bacterium]
MKTREGNKLQFKAMQILPKKNSIRKSVLLYRRILRKKGHGVHSPFVYNLITKVIEERCPYYSFSGIELLRKRLLMQGETACVVAHEAIPPKHCALLFRLANYFRSQNILQIGASAGLSTLYLTSYAKDVRCITLEKTSERASIARWVYEEAARTPIDLRVGDYQNLLPFTLKDMGRIDLVFFNTHKETSNAGLFNICVKYAHPDTVFVFEGIKANNSMLKLWKTVRTHPDVTVTLDLYSIGIAFFNKKLHKRNYTVYF